MLTLARNWHWKIFLRASQRIKIIDHREIYESLRWIISDSWILVENFCEKLENKLLIQFLSMLLQLKSCWNFFLSASSNFFAKRNVFCYLFTTAVPQRRQIQADFVKLKSFSEVQLCASKTPRKVVKTLDFKLKRETWNSIKRRKIEYNLVKLLLRLQFRR